MMFKPRTSDRPVIALVATARFVEGEIVDQAVKTLEDLGCAVWIPPGLYARDFQLAGSDEERFKNFKTEWDNPEIDALWVVRGGYGSIRIAKEVATLIEEQAQAAKWLIGYSDVTALHSLFNNKSICSIHGTMPVNFSKNSEESVTRVVDFLKTGAMSPLDFTPHPFNVAGTAKGRLVGGNLSMLYSLQGTAYAPNYQGSILFFEDLDEYLYHVDRMMQNFLHAEILSQVSGILIGQMSDMNDNSIPWGEEVLEILNRYTKGLGIPVAFNAPFGHADHNLPLLCGAEVELLVSDAGVSLTYI